MKLLETLLAGRRARSRARGFTLIEILAVILILSILVTILVTSLGSAEDATLEGLTEAYLRQLGTALDQYENEFGDYPGSQLGEEAGLKLNDANLGAEALVVALWSEGWEGGGGLSEDDLVNTDGDKSTRSLTDFGTRDLFELADRWGNPIAYFHKTAYGTSQLYVTYDPVSGEPVESFVKAVQNRKTQRYHNPNGFQLLSAGVDGVFGTDDDLGNFRRE